MRNIRFLSAMKKGVVALALTLCIATGSGFASNAEEKGTVTVEAGKIRASADTGSEQVGSVAKGGNVDIISKTTGADGKTWYQVYVDANQKGYIRADLVSVEDSSKIKTTSETTSDNGNTTAPEETTATAVDAKKGTVITSNVRIRKGASTSHDVVATANRGMVVTVTGEADGADGKKWFQISFTYNNKEITGFIRSDLVTFDEVPNDPAVTQITGESADNTDQEVQPEQIPEDTGENVEAEDNNDTQQPVDSVVLLNTEEIPYIQPEFATVTLKWQDQQINAYKNGEFYIFYAQYNGVEGWYMFDSVNNTYQRYVYSQSESVVPGGKTAGNTVIIIILIIVIVILLAAVGLLFFKLREYSVEYEEYADGEEAEDEAFEDIEQFEVDEDKEIEEVPEKKGIKSIFGLGKNRQQYDDSEMEQEAEDVDEEIEIESEQPMRRPQRPVQEMEQPVRRPQRPIQEMEQPMRRPQRPVQEMEQPVRRPQRPVQEMEQPMRRPEGQAPVRRRSEGEMQQRPPYGNRPTGQPQINPNRRPTGQ
ncbi:MAG: SH3 domain-containing protein, partial [Lachnospiraceae bacterium]|nr:SH3 domain-containing protein [Lachnospiraceae bacterium]